MFNKITPSDLYELIENLKIHQIELEMQNDELRSTQARLDHEVLDALVESEKNTACW